MLDENKYKDYKKITGFDTPEEFAAYEKGRADTEKIFLQMLKNWKGETNSMLGQILAKIVEDNQDNFHKEMLE